MSTTWCLAMDAQQLRAMSRRLASDAEAATGSDVPRVRPDGRDDPDDLDVPDPWYGGPRRTTGAVLEIVERTTDDPR